MQDILTPGVVAKLCRVSNTTVNKWLDDGSLQSFELPSGFRRIYTSDLLALAKRLGMRHVVEAIEAPAPRKSRSRVEGARA